MRAQCSRCKSVYNFDDSRIPEEGLEYKCPRCKHIVLVKKTVNRQLSQESVHAESGVNPIVTGVYAGALGGFICAIPAVLLTMLGIGLASLGLGISGFSAAASLVMSFLRMLSLGVMTGIALAFVDAKTEADMWSARGILVGMLIGVIMGLTYGIFMYLIIGGVIGTIAIIGSVFGWIIKTAIVTLAVILSKNYVFRSMEPGSFSLEISGMQKTVTAVLFFFMIFTLGMEAKGLYLTKSSYEESLKEVSAEGLTVKDMKELRNAEGDLVISGLVENLTEDDKTGWYLMAELVDNEDRVISKARLINGAQSYTARDFKIYHERGKRVSPERLLKPDTDVIIKPGESVSFEVVFLNPPREYKECKLTMKDLDLNAMQEYLRESLEDMKELKDMQNMNQGN